MTTTNGLPAGRDGTATAAVLTGEDGPGREPAPARGAAGAGAAGDTGGPAAEPEASTPPDAAGGADDADSRPEEGGDAAAGPGTRGIGALLARCAGWVRRYAAPAGLAVLLAVSGVLLYAAHAAKDPAASGNRALTDTAATAQVTGDVSDAISRIFAYAPDDTATTAQAARDLLGGKAATQYQALFTRIRQQVVQQRLTLTTRVVRAGVESLTADTARLLVFLDQTAQRAGAPATTAAAQLTVTARLEDGHWRITDLTAR